MGREARRNQSEVKAAVYGHKKEPRVTYASLRRQRMREARGHVARMIATAALSRHLQPKEPLIVLTDGDAALQAAIDHGGVFRRPETDGREKVSGANALQRMADPSAADAAQEGPTV